MVGIRAFPIGMAYFQGRTVMIQINPQLRTPSLPEFLAFPTDSNGGIITTGLPRARAGDLGGEHSLDAFQRQSRKSCRGHWVSVGWLDGRNLADTVGYGGGIWVM